MAEEYRFLRFEIVGISTMVLATLGLIFVLPRPTIAAVLTTPELVLGAAALVLFVSLPLGYGLHQLLVNIHRSERRLRPAHKLVRDALVNIEVRSSEPHQVGQPIITSLDYRSLASLLTAVLDVLIHGSTELVPIDPIIHDRIESRWSHFYARRAVGKLSPLSAVAIFVLITLALASEGIELVLTYQSLLLVVFYWFVVLALFARFIDRYSQKLWEEICYLELAIVSVNLPHMTSALQAIVDVYRRDPSLVRNLDSYGIGFQL